MIVPPSHEAVSELKACLRDPSEWVRRNAVEAMGMIGSDADDVPWPWQTYWKSRFCKRKTEELLNR